MLLSNPKKEKPKQISGDIDNGQWMMDRQILLGKYYFTFNNMSRKLVSSNEISIVVV